MKGSTHSLPLKPRAPPPWRAAAAELLPSRRAAAPPRCGRFRLRPARRLLRCQEAIIRQEFAYRFHMAMQEVCPRKRQAVIAQLAGEQQGTLRQARETTLAEERSDRERRPSAMAARRRYRLNSARRPRRPRRRRGRSGHWFGNVPIC